VLLPIQEVAHKIHGSGAMFGFARISESAGVLEGLSAQIAREITAVGAAAHVEYTRRLTASVEQVAEALAAAQEPV
jgi:HPt (histidine-containing phosphotransfer) domain-containing protein